MGRAISLAVGLDVSVTLDGLIIHSAYVREGEDTDTLPVGKGLDLGRYRLELVAETDGGEHEIRFLAEEMERDA